jgi:hypothetical protein
MRRAFLLFAFVIAACTAPGTSPGAAPSPSASASTRPVPSNWPPGVPPPPTPKPGPAIGPSEKDATNLQIAYVPPHIVFTASGIPDGVYSVIYTVNSKRNQQDKLQIDSVDPMAAFKAKLEYARLVRGAYEVRLYIKNAVLPSDVRTITVP